MTHLPDGLSLSCFPRPGLGISLDERTSSQKSFSIDPPISRSDICAFDFPAVDYSAEPTFLGKIKYDCHLAALVQIRPHLGELACPPPGRIPPPSPDPGNEGVQVASAHLLHHSAVSPQDPIHVCPEEQRLRSEAPGKEPCDEVARHNPCPATPLEDNIAANGRNEAAFQCPACRSHEAFLVGDVAIIECEGAGGVDAE